MNINYAEHLAKRFAGKQARVRYRGLKTIPIILKKSENNALDMNLIVKPTQNVDDVMFGAASVLEGYAKRKGVFINLVRNLKVMCDDVHRVEDYINIRVFNPKTKKKMATKVPADVDKIYTRIEKKQRIFNIDQDGTQVSRPVRSVYQEPFLRYFYRVVEGLVKNTLKRG